MCWIKNVQNVIAVEGKRNKPHLEEKEGKREEKVETMEKND